MLYAQVSLKKFNIIIFPKFDSNQNLCLGGKKLVSFYPNAFKRYIIIDETNFFYINELIS